MSQISQNAVQVKNNGWKLIARKAWGLFQGKFAHSQGRLLTTELDPYVTIKELIKQGRLTSDTNLILKHYNLKRVALFSELVRCAGEQIFDYVNGADASFAEQIIKNYSHNPSIAQYARDIEFLKEIIPIQTQPDECGFKVYFDRKKDFIWVEETGNGASDATPNGSPVFYEEMGEQLKKFTKEWNTSFLNGHTVAFGGGVWDKQLKPYTKKILCRYLAWRGEEFNENAIQAMADRIERKLRAISNDKGMAKAGRFVLNTVYHPGFLRTRASRKQVEQMLAVVANAGKISSKEVVLLLEQTVEEYKKQVNGIKKEDTAVPLDADRRGALQQKAAESGHEKISLE